MNRPMGPQTQHGMGAPLLVFSLGEHLVFVLGVLDERPHGRECESEKSERYCLEGTG